MSTPLRGFPEAGTVAGPVAATIGVFDGVHLGHQALLHEAAAIGGNVLLITFDPHPRCVLDPNGCPPALSTIAERAALAAQHGATMTSVLAFTPELRMWSPQRFCDRLLECIDLRRLVIGPGFALGHQRAGDETFLRGYAAAHDFDLVTVPPVTHDGAPVSSRRIRSTLMDGDVGAAAAMLGRTHRLSGPVVRGDARGRTLGFPTANVAVDAGRCLPAAGVYATWFNTGDAWHAAATSIGRRPTFGGGELTVESFLLDTDVDLYGRDVQLDFVARVREERMYEDADLLVAQMHDDVHVVRRLLASVGSLAAP